MSKNCDVLYLIIDFRSWRNATFPKQWYLIDVLDVCMSAKHINNTTSKSFTTIKY